MSIVLVGGHDRMHREYKVIADKHGHKLKVFTQITSRFHKSIGTPDAIVLFMNTVSHKMVHIATREAKRKKIPVLRSHTSSGNSLEKTIKELEQSVC